MRTLRLVIILLCAVPVSLCGQLLEWESAKGQFGGIIYSLAFTGTSGFAGTGGKGVFRFAPDSGGWTPANNGLTNTYVGSLTATGGTIYAGTWGGGVFRSTDNGISWAEYNNGLGSVDVQVLASGEATVFAGTSDGIYRITSGDTAWKDVGVTLPSRYILTLCAVSPQVYAGTNDGQLFRSGDNGATWKELSIPAGVVRSITAHSAGVYIGYDSALYRSADNGDHWTESGSGLPRTLITSLATADGVLFAGVKGGVYRSVDNGVSWVQSDSGVYYRSVVALAAKGGKVAAGTREGMVYRSVDTALNWSYVNHALIPSHINFIQRIRTDLYAGTTDGLFRSADSSKSWVPVAPVVRYDDITAIGVLDSIILVGTQKKGLLRYNGNTWAGISDTLFLNSLGEFTTVRCIYVHDTTTFAGIGERLFRSDDYGLTWREIKYLGRSVGVRSIGNIGGELYLGVGSGYLRSDDGGTTFIRSYVNLGPNYNIIPVVYSIVIDGGDKYAGIDGMIVKNTNNADLWTEIFRDYAFCLEKSGRSLLAGTQGSGVIRSNNGGTKFFAENKGLPSVNVLRSVVSFCRLDTVLFAASTGSGLFRTKNSILTSVEEPLPMAEVSQPVIIPNPAGSDGASVALGRVEGHISLTLRDAIGRVVRMVYNGDAVAVPATFTIDTHGIPAGIYYLTGYAGSRAVCLPLCIVR